MAWRLSVTAASHAVRDLSATDTRCRRGRAGARRGAGALEREDGISAGRLSGRLSLHGAWTRGESLGDLYPRPTQTMNQIKSSQHHVSDRDVALNVNFLLYNLKSNRYSPNSGSKLSTVITINTNKSTRRRH